MQQQISVITLGIADFARSKRFYVEGFGWTPVFETPEIVFYQMNGLMLGTWLARGARGRHAARPRPARRLRAGAQCRRRSAEVQPVLDRLAAPWRRLLRAADAPPHGGFRGYVADPDDHAWEIAYNPAWPISSGRTGDVRAVRPRD